MSESDRDWTPAEREALRGLAGEIEPPAGREEELVAALRRQGMLGGGGRGRWTGWLAAAAAVAVAFLGGVGLGRGGDGRPEATGPRFALLLEETAATAAIDPAEGPRLVAEYGAWARSVGAAGRFIAGEKLAPGGRRLAAAEGGFGIEPLPEAGVDRGLGGFFVIEARDWEAALAVARTCPHLRHGGSIEVRRIDDV